MLLRINPVLSIAAKETFLKLGKELKCVATISARVDDQVKSSAEGVADAIGISLSTAINIFLKRFAAERGFPFDVVAPESGPTAGRLDRIELERSVQAAIADKDNSGHVDHFTYIDPNTGELTTHIQ